MTFCENVDFFFKEKKKMAKMTDKKHFTNHIPHL